VGESAIKVANDVCAAFIAGYDYHGSEVSRSHFSVKGLLYSRVTHEYEVSALEVKVLECSGVFALKSYGCVVAGPVYAVSESSKVVLTLL
jgi:hypothetical protein